MNSGGSPEVKDSASAQEMERTLEHVERGQGYVAVAVTSSQASQSYQNVTRLVEDFGAKPVEVPFDTPADILKKFDGVIFSGSGESVTAEDAPRIDEAVLDDDFDVPLLGICYGAQRLAYMMSGNDAGAVASDGQGEYGGTNVTFTPGTSELLKGFSMSEEWMSHGDHIVEEKLPDSVTVTGRSTDYIAAYEDTDAGVYGLQFHPEQGSSQHGFEMIRNFLEGVAGIDLDPQPKRLLKELVENFNKQLGPDKHAVMPVSGGVDSTVMAMALANTDAAKEDRIHVVHLDNGAMRLFDGVPESNLVVETLEGLGFSVDLLEFTDEDYERNVAITNQAGEYLGEHSLNGSVDPEIQRMVFSVLYGEKFEAYGESIGLPPEDVMVVQGTLYTDLVESGALDSAVIKSHHNATKWFQDKKARGETIDPADKFYKEDMRRIGEELGLSAEITERQPAPGPALLLGVVCAQEAALLDGIDEAHAQITEYIHTTYSSDYSVYTPPILTTGVMGDESTFLHGFALSSDRAQLDWDEMSEITSDVTNRFKKFYSRGYYLRGEPMQGVGTDITPTTFEGPNQGSLRQLQEVEDRIARRFKSAGLMAPEAMSQLAVGLFPLPFDKPGTRAVSLRPFLSPKKFGFTSGRAALPGKPAQEGAPIFEEQVVLEIMDEIAALQGISRVFYDLTAKPSATVLYK